MKKLLGWLLGWVTAEVTGAQPEDFLNACARLGVGLLKMEREDPFTLSVSAWGRQEKDLLAAGAQSQCAVTIRRRRGLPFFLYGLRRRYGLAVGAVLFLGMVLVGSRFLFTIDVTGNVTVSTEEILSQLRLCGVSVGTYGPSIPIRSVENRVLLGIDQLTFCAVNLHGTRAEVIVREKTPAPEVDPEDIPADVISSATGIITHLEPWAGDAQVSEGDMVLEGDTLISGLMDLEAIPPAEGSLGTMLVRAEGKILARTWHRDTAQIQLTATGKAYTGEETTRYALSLMGKRVKFYQNSGISYPNYDTISESKSWTPVAGKSLPILWEKETYRAYTPTTLTLDPDQAAELLKERLRSALAQRMDQGEILTEDYTVTRTGDTLTVTLMAQCTEQIGRTQEREGEAIGPVHPFHTDQNTEGSD
jgi:similar to stage IV sporulation protein